MDLTSGLSAYLSIILTPLLLICSTFLIFLTISSIIIFHKTPLSSLTAIHLLVFIVSSLLSSIRRTSIAQLLLQTYGLTFGLKVAGWGFAKLAETRTPLPKALMLGGLVLASAMLLAIGTLQEESDVQGMVDHEERGYSR